MRLCPPLPLVTLLPLPLVWVVACQPAVVPEVPATPAAPVRAVESAVLPAASQHGLAVRHDLRFDAANAHMIDVEMAIPEDHGATLELWMPTWTPGSYLIREYARNIESLEARGPDGKPLLVQRTAKNRWVVDGAEGAVAVHYRLYANEPRVQASYVDGDGAIINGASLFLALADDRVRAQRVVAHLPKTWGGGWTGLDRSAGGGPTDWTAADLDELIDSPIVLGNAEVTTFEAGGAPHRFVLMGNTAGWDLDKVTADVAAITRTTQALWGNVPYAEYTFLNVANNTRGGLEHLDSTLMMSANRVMGDPETYQSWLGLVSHEFFHTWNVKRLRPAPLGPFDYEAEVYTPSLWVAEGLTSYYDDLLLVRAGLMDEKAYLQRITDQIGKLSETPGRTVQTLEQASADAWIKHYRRDENSVNTAISYYVKGMAVGFVLDARIRAATEGQKSLDDALRLAWTRHSGERGFTPAELETVLRDTVGPDEAAALQAFLDRALRTTEELDYTPALDWFGLKLVSPDDKGEDDETSDEGEAPEDGAPTPGWMGEETRNDGGRVVISTLQRGTPAMDAGLLVGDELVAVDGFRVPKDGLAVLMKEHRPGQTVVVTVSRAGRLRTVAVELGEAPAPTLVLKVDPEATAEAVAHRAAWLARVP